VGDQVQRLVRAVGELDGQELAVPRRAGDHPAYQRRHRRIECLDGTHARHVDARDRPVQRVLAQVVGQRLDLRELRHQFTG
jgi:hypothetical protein